LDCDLELMRNPGVGASLTHPAADSVQLWSQRSSRHRNAENTGGRADDLAPLPSAQGWETLSIGK
jgi:hypothetical protein